MVRKWVGPDEISKLIDKFQEAAMTLQGLKGSMIDPGPKKIELNYKKADSYATHLVDWAAKAKHKHRVEQLDSSADAERDATEKRRGKKNSEKKSS